MHPLFGLYDINRGRAWAGDLCDGFLVPATSCFVTARRREPDTRLSEVQLEGFRRERLKADPSLMVTGVSPRGFRGWSLDCLWKEVSPVSLQLWFRTSGHVVVHEGLSTWLLKKPLQAFLPRPPPPPSPWA